MLDLFRWPFLLALTGLGCVAVGFPVAPHSAAASADDAACRAAVPPELAALGAVGLVLVPAVLLWQLVRLRDARRAVMKATQVPSEFLANMSLACPGMELDPSPASPVAGPLLPTALPAGERVLVVDDNPVNQIVALRAVGNLGYAAEVVSGGETALEALGRDRFAAILMDCQMPGMDGYQVAREIRRRECCHRPEARTAIIAMTANAAEGDPEKCRAAGMDDYLTKPIRMAELSRALEHWTRTAAVTGHAASRARSSPKPPGPPSGHSPTAPPEAGLRV